VYNNVSIVETFIGTYTCDCLSTSTSTSISNFTERRKEMPYNTDIPFQFLLVHVFCAEYSCTSFMKVDFAFSVLITRVTSGFSETFSCWVSRLVLTRVLIVLVLLLRVSVQILFCFIGILDVFRFWCTCTVCVEAYAYMCLFLLLLFICHS